MKYSEENLEAPSNADNDISIMLQHPKRTHFQISGVRTIQRLCFNFMKFTVLDGPPSLTQ